MITGIVTDIQRFSIHDGPGIRTTVFMKGCPLRCAWCHNPETLSPAPQVQVLPDKCIGCGECLTACPRGAHVMVEGRRVFLRQRCAACGRCAETCYAGALTLVGKTMTAEEVTAQVLRDRPFYDNSGGGVTLSGGEPLCQCEFSREVLRLCKDAGLHTAVETNLAAPWEDLASILPVTDLVLADVKMMDPALHQRWTHLPNDGVLANARRLSQQAVDLVVRTPVIPGVNDTSDQIGRIADFIAGFANLLYYELLPYHPLGRGKYESLGLPPAMPDTRAPAPEHMQALAEAARQRGIKVLPAPPGEDRP